MRVILFGWGYFESKIHIIEEFYANHEGGKMSFKYEFTLKDWERFWPELLEAIQDIRLVKKLKEAHEERRIDLEKRHFRRILNF